MKFKRQNQNEVHITVEVNDIDHILTPPERDLFSSNITGIHGPISAPALQGDDQGGEGLGQEEISIHILGAIGPDRSKEHRGDQESPSIDTAPPFARTMMYSSR